MHLFELAENIGVQKGYGNTDSICISLQATLTLRLFTVFKSTFFFLIFCIISCLRVAFHKHFGDIKLLFFWSIYTPCVLRVYAQLCPTLCDPHGIQPSRLSPWNFPGKNTGVGFHFLLQVIFLTHISSVFCLGRRILYQSSHLGIGVGIDIH